MKRREFGEAQEQKSGETETSPNFANEISIVYRTPFFSNRVMMPNGNMNF